MARHRYTEDEPPKLKLTKESIKEALIIFSYLKPYRNTFILGLVFIGLSSGSSMAFPYLLKQLIDSAHDFHPGTFTGTPATIALVMIGVLVLQMIFSFMRIYLFSIVGENAVGNMRKDLYSKIITMQMDFFSRHRVGELSSRITADVGQIQDAVTNVFAEILRGILTLIIGIGLILYISPRLTLLMLSVVPVIILIAFVFSKHLRALSRKAQDELAQSGVIVHETLQGITSVKAFNNEWFETGRYTASINRVIQVSIKSGRFNAFFVSFLLFTVFGSIVMVVWYGAGLMQHGILTFGSMTAFVVYTAFVGGTMASFAGLYSQLQKTLGATQRVRKLLTEDTENVSVVPVCLDANFKLTGAVKVEHISFSYPSRPDIQVLNNVNITAAPGEQVAIVGPSGSGKTTLASLLLRFYEPDKGSILFDGRDATTIPLTQLRKQMALVPQDVLLFGGTIYENIAYGNPDATVTQVEDAARKANAHNFITGFPDGYKTIVGERGIQLSGGQRQRIAIARAILKDPVILILDEATSSLDSESEVLVQEALQNLMKNRTSFVIAHRLSTIRNADKIVVIENGTVKETGTHEELVAMDEGLYKHLNRLQIADK